MAPVRARSIRPRYIAVSTDTRYLTIGQLCERFGVSTMWIWRHMRDHGFPPPIKFGGPTSARHWKIEEIEQWERERANTQGGCDRKTTP
jgi:predicted DNA-binding transcriptional regulator AlpA